MTVDELSRRGFLTGVGSLAVAFTLGPAVLDRQAAHASAAGSPGLRVDEADERDSLSWLVLTPAGLTIHSGKVELGTGVRTALTQVVVEELHVSMDRVSFVEGDTRVTPNQGATVGSETIKDGAPELRQAAATAFQGMLNLAAEHFGVSKDRLVASDGVITVIGTKRRVTYEQLLANADDVVLVDDPDAPLKHPDDYEIVGTPVRRVDLPGKVTAQHRYVHDVVVPGMLHGRIIRPSGRNATFASIDSGSLARAEAIPGFVTVVRQDNFVGVVARTEWAAIQAADPSAGIQVTWHDGQPLLPQETLPDELRDPANHYGTVTMVDDGDVDAALADAAERREATYFTPFHMHGAMSPSCSVVDVRPGPDPDTGVQVTAWSSTQNIYNLRRTLASLLDVPIESVHVIYYEAAGCYGHNGADDVAGDAALLSQAAGKPVRVQWSRQDEHGWEPLGPPMTHELRGGVTDGGIVSWEHTLHAPTHNSRPRGNPGTLLAGSLTGSLPSSLPGSPGNAGGRNGPVTYTFANNRLIGTLVRSFETAGDGSGEVEAPLRYRLMRTTALRSLGGFSNSFANESFFDELAAAGQADPLELRLRYLDDPRSIAVLEAIRDAWEARPPGGDGVGAGIAFQRYEIEFTYVAAYLEVEVDSTTGNVRVPKVLIAHDCGLVVNPDGLRNQIEGNVVQGISRTLKEEVKYDAHGVTSVVWQQSRFNPMPQYPILRFSEVPDVVESIVINRPDQPAWGAGEPAIGVIPGAIGNAIFAATGARVRTLPMTPDRVLDALSKR